MGGLLSFYLSIQLMNSLLQRKSVKLHGVNDRTNPVTGLIEKNNSLSTAKKDPLPEQRAFYKEFHI